mgnify:FL=1
MPGPRGPRGPKPKIKNPGKLFARLMGFIFKKYLPACIIVVICIFVSVLANVQGTMFTKNLIDDYIVPLLKTGTPDYGHSLQQWEGSPYSTASASSAHLPTAK